MWNASPSAIDEPNSNHIDLVTANSGSNNVSVLLNTCSPPPTSTPTATPTVTNTPTSTPVPVLVGHAIWQGLPAQPSVKQILPITLTLTLGSTSTEYSAQLTDANGFFTTTVSTMPLGVYTWRAKGNTYLSNSGTFTLTGGLNNLEMGLMRTGDLNGDNVMNSPDFTNLKGNFGGGGAQPQGNPSGSKRP